MANDKFKTYGEKKKQVGATIMYKGFVTCSMHCSSKLFSPVILLLLLFFLPIRLLISVFLPRQLLNGKAHFFSLHLKSNKVNVGFTITIEFQWLFIGRVFSIAVSFPSPLFLLAVGIVVVVVAVVAKQMKRP